MWGGRTKQAAEQSVATNHQKMTEVSQVLSNLPFVQHCHVPNSAALAAPQHARRPRGPCSLCTSCRLHHSTQLLHHCCVHVTPNDTTTFKNNVLCPSLNTADILRKKMKTVFFTLFCTLTLPDAQPVDTEIVLTNWMANPQNKLTMHCLYHFQPTDALSLTSNALTAFKGLRSPSGHLPPSENRNIPISCHVLSAEGITDEWLYPWPAQVLSFKAAGSSCKNEVLDTTFTFVELSFAIIA